MSNERLIVLGADAAWMSAVSQAIAVGPSWRSSSLSGASIPPFAGVMAWTFGREK